MYKSRLQELCQRLSWNLPEYRAEREGPDHNPRFTATVTVNGLPFCNDNPFKSSREAQNDAARVAFEHFTRPELTTPNAVATLNPNAGPLNASTHAISRWHLSHQMGPSTTANGLAGVPKMDAGFSGFSSATSGQGSVFATRGISQPRAQSMCPVQQVDGNASSYENNGTMVAGIQHLYKNQLQIYAQKRNLVLPLYSHEREGPPHASIFRCKVTVDGKTYESQEFSSTLKEAEHIAAKVALMSLFQDGLQEDDPGLYKNLLQELAQKEGFSIPCYHTDRYGHIPSFISTVRIEGESFTGDQAKTKKQSEMNAAKVAYFTLKKRNPDKTSKILSAVQQGPKACELSSHVPSLEITAEPQQVARAKSSPTLTPVVTSSAQAEQSIEKTEVSSQHCDMLSPEPYSTRKADSSSDDIISACWQDSIPSVPYAKDGPSSSSLLSECFKKLTVSNGAESSADMLTHIREVIVFPRSANMAVPDDCTVLPISDDVLVAVERRSNQV